MKRTIAIAVVFFALTGIATAATEPPHHGAIKPRVHKTVAPSSVVKITMPGDLSFDYKRGPGQQVAQTYCLTCHSSGYVSMQPPMDAEHWAKTVAKMRKAYGMQISDADATKVADYLGTAYGPPTHQAP